MATPTFGFVKGVNVTPMGYQQILDAALTAAVGLTVPTKDKANLAIIQNDPLVSTQAVRYTDDGSVPTAALGMVLDVGDMLEYTGDLSALQFIKAAVGAQLNISYYKAGPGNE